MPKKSKIRAKEYTKTFKQCVFQLKQIRDDAGLINKIRTCASQKKRSIDASDSTIEREVKNAWGQKDVNSILKEKDERLKALEIELEEKSKSIQQLAEEKHKTKRSLENEHKETQFIQMLQQKDKHTASLMLENDINKRNIAEIEAQLQLEKKANEILKEANKYLSEIGNKKTSPIVKKDYIGSLNNNIDSEREIQRLLQLNTTKDLEMLSIQQSHKPCNLLITDLKELVTDLEFRLKFKSFCKEIEINDMEAALMDEIDNITSAYDKISCTNMQMEKTLLLLNSQVSDLSKENFSLKNRLLYFEDNKIFIEKDKKRLEEWKYALAEETRKFQDKAVEMENIINEKDKKVTDYKSMITNLQANHKILQDELNILNSNHRNVKRELETIQAEAQHLKTEYETKTKLLELYKGYCSTDVEVLEDLERYKKAIRCSLCDTNMKNCVILKCSHAFCNGCLEDRLKARQRHCPFCQTEFRANDIKKLYL